MPSETPQTEAAHFVELAGDLDALERNPPVVSQAFHAQDAQPYRFVLPPEAAAALAPLAQQKR